MSGLREEASDLEATMGKAVEAASSGVGGVKTAAEETKKIVEELATLPEATATVFDDMIDIIRRSNDEYAPFLIEQIKLVKDGVTSVEEFRIAVQGIPLITEEGRKTIREFLDQVDPGVVEDKINQIREAIRTGSATLSEALGAFKAIGADVAAALDRIWQQFRAGQITLERMTSLFEELREKFRNTDAGDAIETILDEIRRNPPVPGSGGGAQP